MNASQGRQLALAALLFSALGNAQAASFTYEGRLDDLGQPANGRYDLKLSVFDHASQGATLAAPITFAGVEVREGRFRLDVELPLAKVAQLWLEVAVRQSGEPTFSAIAGRAKAIAAPLIGYWSTTGSAYTNPTFNFIGTTDAQPFVIRTANARSLRIEPSSITFGAPALPITTNTIGGSHANAVTAGVRGATIAGGGVPSVGSDPEFSGEAPNRVTDHYGTVGGGYANRAGDDAGATTDRAFATVGGGAGNTASGLSSTVGGGTSNTASGERSTVGGGAANTASGVRSTVGGGDYNTASGSLSTVGGGAGNTANGNYSTVGGGVSNCAGGDHSWAGGTRAKVRPGAAPGGNGPCSSSSLTYPGGTGDQGTFVWADTALPDFVSTGSNQFLVRAAGGFGFNTNSIPAGRLINTSTGAFLSSGGTWTNASSRALKTAFESIDPGDVLARLLALPVMRWQYRESPAEGVHLGPVAEEFHAAFGLGADGRAISTVDATGVALAAIQGLNAKLEAERNALHEQLEGLGAENTQLRAGYERLAAELAELRALVRGNAAER